MTISGTSMSRCAPHRPGARVLRRMRALVGGLACWLLVGCDLTPKKTPEQGETPRATPDHALSAREPTPSQPLDETGNRTSPDRRLAPLWDDDWLVELEVSGFRNAQLALPRGAVTPRRVIVALHGYADRPEWQCGAWTGISDAKMFVLCPTGVALPRPQPNFGFGSPRETRKEVLAALAALEQRYGAYVSKNPVILVGYSLGAQRAAHLAAEDPARFPEVALVEGGTRAWSKQFARKFSEGGGKRMLFVCTQLGCRGLVQHLAKFTESTDVLARGAYLGNFGHHMGPQVTSRIKEHFFWLIQAEPVTG